MEQWHLPILFILGGQTQGEPGGHDDHLPLHVRCVWGADRWRLWSHSQKWWPGVPGWCQHERPGEQQNVITWAFCFLIKKKQTKQNLLLYWVLKANRIKVYRWAVNRWTLVSATCTKTVFTADQPPPITDWLSDLPPLLLLLLHHLNLKINTHIN